MPHDFNARSADIVKLLVGWDRTQAMLRLQKEDSMKKTSVSRHKPNLWQKKLAAAEIMDCRARPPGKDLGATALCVDGLTSDCEEGYMDSAQSARVKKLVVQMFESEDGASLLSHARKYQHQHEAGGVQHTLEPGVWHTFTANSHTPSRPRAGAFAGMAVPLPPINGPTRMDAQGAGARGVPPSPLPIIRGPRPHPIAKDHQALQGISGEAQTAVSHSSSSQSASLRTSQKDSLGRTSQKDGLGRTPQQDGLGSHPYTPPALESSSLRTSQKEALNSHPHTPLYTAPPSPHRRSGSLTSASMASPSASLRTLASRAGTGSLSRVTPPYIAKHPLAEAGAAPDADMMVLGVGVVPIEIDMPEGIQERDGDAPSPPPEYRVAPGGDAKAGLDSLAAVAEGVAKVCSTPEMPGPVVGVTPAAKSPVQPHSSDATVVPVPPPTPGKKGKKGKQGKKGKRTLAVVVHLEPPLNSLRPSRVPPTPMTTTGCLTCHPDDWLETNHKLMDQVVRYNPSGG
eukprot:gene29794-7429_t